MTCMTIYLQTDSSMWTTSNSNNFKLIAPGSRYAILQSSLNARASWSKDWKLYLNSTKSEHISIGKFENFYHLHSLVP